MLSIKSDGLGKLEKLAKNAAELSRKTAVTFDELFSQKFMSAHTQFSDFTEFVRGGGFILKNADDFKAIPDEEFDNYVRQNTGFSNWQEMRVAAARVWAKQQLLK